MKIRSLALIEIFLICLVVASIAAGAPPVVEGGKPAAENNDQLERQIGRLVSQLTADRAADRDTAEKQLLELAGKSTATADKFLASLPKDSDQMPLALRDRLARIRRQVEENVSKSATAGTTVTLAAKNMPLADVLKAVETQTGNKFIDNRDDQPGPDQKGVTVSIDLKNEPFWPAMDHILDAAQLGLYAYGGEDALSIVARPKDDAPRFGRAFYAGPFRLEVLDARGQRNFRLPNQTSLKLQLEVAWEPRLRPIALSQPLADVQAIADNGSQLALGQPDSEQDVEIPNGTQAAEIVLPFKLPSRGIKKITKLNGKLRALVPGRHAKFEFPDATKAIGKSQRLGGVQVTLKEVRKNNAVWEVHMQLTLDEAKGSLQSHRGWVFQNLSYLVDKDGKRVENAGFETTRQTPNEVGAAYMFDVAEGLENMTWVYETPASIIEMPIDYELKEIELP